MPDHIGVFEQIQNIKKLAKTIYPVALDKKIPVLFSEYLLPEGDEALSEDAEAAIAGILVKDITKRPEAQGSY